MSNTENEKKDTNLGIIAADIVGTLAVNEFLSAAFANIIPTKTTFIPKILFGLGRIIVSGVITNSVTNAFVDEIEVLTKTIKTEIDETEKKLKDTDEQKHDFHFVYVEPEC